MGEQNMITKYGIRVLLDDKYIWVMEDSGLPFPDNQRVKLFDSQEAANAAAIAWKNYRVEEYHDISKFDWDSLANNQSA